MAMSIWENELEWVKNHLEKWRPQGQSFIACCPFHPDRHPSLSIEPVKRAWVCHGCGERGKLSDLARRLGFSTPRGLADPPRSFRRPTEHDRIAAAAHADYDRRLRGWHAAENRGERPFISSADYHAWELMHDRVGRRVPPTEISSGNNLASPSANEYQEELEQRRAWAEAEFNRLCLAWANAVSALAHVEPLSAAAEVAHGTLDSLRAEIADFWRQPGFLDLQWWGEWVDRHPDRLFTMAEIDVHGMRPRDWDGSGEWEWLPWSNGGVAV